MKKNSIISTGNDILKKLLGISPAKMEELEGDRVLKDKGSGSAASGTVRPSDGSTGEKAEHSEVESGGGATQKRIPTLAEVAAEVRAALKDATAEAERVSTVGRLNSLASSLTESGSDRRESGSEKSDAVWRLLAELASKQGGGWQELISYVKEGDYLSGPAAESILAGYEAAGERASANESAASAADNGGNIDSYGAANAHRQRLAYLDAGNAAALDYYERQADRLAELLLSSGDQLSDIYGRMQDNADSDYSFAAKSVDAASDMLTQLLRDNSDRADREWDAILSAYGKTAERAEEAADPEAPSPMLVDSEYDRLMSEEGMSSTNALLALWRRYPEMREYIAEKYEKKLSSEDTYVFKK